MTIQSGSDTSAEQGARDLGQAIHAHTRQQVLDYLPQLTAFVLREIRIQEGFGNFWLREVQPEEIIDAVVLDALERGDTRPAGQAPFPWLRGIARTVIQRELAAARERRTWESESIQDLDSILSPDVAIDEGAAGRPQPLMSANAENSIGLTPDDRAVEGEFRATVLRILRDMPQDLVDPLILRVRDQRPPDEVAQLEGISIQELDRRVAEAARTLRERLQNEYDDLEGVPAVEALIEAVEEETLSDEQFAQLAARLSNSDARMHDTGRGR